MDTDVDQGSALLATPHAGERGGGGVEIKRKKNRERENRKNESDESKTHIFHESSASTSAVKLSVNCSVLRLKEGRLANLVRIQSRVHACYLTFQFVLPFTLSVNAQGA